MPEHNTNEQLGILDKLIKIKKCKLCTIALSPRLKCVIPFCSPLLWKRGDIKSHLSVCPSVCPSVTKTLTLAITFALLQIELWYLACVFLVTRPFRWYHVVTLTVTFDLLQGQICCRAGDHNSLNLLVYFGVEFFKTVDSGAQGIKVKIFHFLVKNAVFMKNGNEY